MNQRPQQRISLSRGNSSGSPASNNDFILANMTGNQSDDEDSDGRGNSQLSYKERRREAHTQAEQKRRDAIKKGYEYLQDLVPTITNGDDASPTSASASSAKASKAVVLQKAIDYIQHVETQKKKQETDLSCLRKELAALQIMRDNYDQLVKAHQSSTASAAGDQSEDGVFVPSEVKFRVFQMLMDTLFMSFNETVSMNNFQDLSRGVISWLEEQCTPYALQDLMLNILDQVRSEAEVNGNEACSLPNSNGV